MTESEIPPLFFYFSSCWSCPEESITHVETGIHYLKNKQKQVPVLKSLHDNGVRRDSEREFSGTSLSSLSSKSTQHVGPRCIIRQWQRTWALFIWTQVPAPLCGLSVSPWDWQSSIARSRSEFRTGPPHLKSFRVQKASFLASRQTFQCWDPTKSKGKRD